jgi:hypothetical protein
MLEHPQKPENIAWISNETWEKLSLKEKDYFIFLIVEKLKKKEIMRKLYLNCDKSLRNFRYNLYKKLDFDLKKIVKKL